MWSSPQECAFLDSCTTGCQGTITPSRWIFETEPVRDNKVTEFASEFEQIVGKNQHIAHPKTTNKMVSKLLLEQKFIPMFILFPLAPSAHQVAYKTTTMTAILLNSEWMDGSAQHKAFGFVKIPQHGAIQSEYIASCVRLSSLLGHTTIIRPQDQTLK